MSYDHVQIMFTSRAVFSLRVESLSHLMEFAETPSCSCIACDRKHPFPNAVSLSQLYLRILAMLHPVSY
jgi:hypothetical protein